ncbi:hypothetical protein [Algoriphagus sp. AK58]|uniref:hypothetical protein n=1 Tax=Algoriphagus sp. AK58 TaxID=1406877 RepID=UPI00164FABCA|nr:hypothetical protein [Algoriphagus sp. AK58]MBC6368648.1 hypothetical protein [Algoriphagus sp. AK58]
MRILVACILICLVSHTSWAQFEDKVQLGLYGNIGFPVGEFSQTVSNSMGGTGWGTGINFLFNPKKGREFSPVLIGIEGNYLHLGTEKTPESQFLPRLKTTFNYFNVGPIIRAMLSNKEEGIIPFVDGFVGLKVLNTKTKIDNSLLDTLLDQEYLESLLSTNYEGLGYGLGIGFFSRKIKNEPFDTSASFYLKLQYQYGDRINYVKRGSVEVDREGFITYETGKTPTSLLSLQLGILFR